MPSLYIHVPFCQKRCHYCSFYSTTFGKRERDLYCDALISEMQGRRTDDRITTVYFGGGTPSQLDAEELRRIFAALRTNYHVAPDAEVTFECNPDDIAPLKHAEKAADDDAESFGATLLSLLKELGVNRISLGVQSFDDKMLSAINRRHNACQAIGAVEACHRAGIHNISIDLIYGLPGQSMAAWRRDVDKAMRLVGRDDGVTHVSSYCLSIEPGTHLYNMRVREEIVETDEETLSAMYDYLVKQAAAAGMEHYEISNFAIPGYASKHNSSYWGGVPYIGLGPGAHSYDGHNTRRWNLQQLSRYLLDPCNNYEDEHLTDDELYDELIMTRLRMAAGLPLSSVEEHRRSYLLRQAQSYIKSGHLKLEGTSPSEISPESAEFTPESAEVSPEHETRVLRLTHKGIFISDTIFADLMCDV